MFEGVGGGRKKGEQLTQLQARHKQRCDIHD